MIKFLRKHNKRLLAVSLVFLMIVFIGGSALTDMMAPAFNPVLGRGHYGKVVQSDINVSKTTTGILSALGFQWQYPLGALTAPISQLDWVLLGREVDALGMRQPMEAARATLGKIYTDDQIDLLCRRRRFQPDRVYGALAEFLSISEVAKSMILAIPPGEAEVRRAAFDALDKVQVNVVLLPARAFMDENVAVAEADLDSLFQQYRGTKPGRGLDFGYFVPPAVKLQYIKIDRDKIASEIGIPNLEREARKYYDENRESRFRRAPNADAPDEPGVAQSAFLSWEEGREDAIKAIRSQRADTFATRVTSWLADYAADPFVEVERGEDGYRVAPASVTGSGYYDEIVEQLPRKLRAPGAITVGQTDYFSRNEAGTIPDIGGTWARDGQGGWLGSLATVAFQTKAIVDKVSDIDGAGVDEYVSMHQTAYYPLGDANGNKFIWRIVDVRVGHQATKLEEVRARVVEDLKLKNAYDDAMNYGRTLSFAASESTLNEAFESDLDLQEIVGGPGGGSIAYSEPPAFARTRVASQGRPPEGLRVSFGLINNEDVDRCFALQQSHERVIVIGVKDSASVAVVEWVDTVPGREDEFARLQPTLRTSLVNQRNRDAIGSWFDSESIQARAGYKREGAQ